MAGFTHISHVLKGKSSHKSAYLFLERAWQNYQLLSLTHSPGENLIHSNQNIWRTPTKKKTKPVKYKARIHSSITEVLVLGTAGMPQSHKAAGFTAPSAEVVMELVASPRVHLLWREVWSSYIVPCPLHIPPSLFQIREFLLTQQKLDWFAFKRNRQLWASAFASCVPGENKSRKQRGRVGEVQEFPGIQLPLLAKGSLARTRTSSLHSTFSRFSYLFL